MEEEAVLDLTIDASDAAAGGDALVRTLEQIDNASTGAAEGLDRVGVSATQEAAAIERARQAADQATSSTIRMVESSSRQEKALDRVRAQADPVFRAYQRISSAEALFDNAVKSGLITVEERNRVISQYAERLGTASSVAEEASRREVAAAQMAAKARSDQAAQLAADTARVDASMRQREQAAERQIAILWREVEATQALINAERQRETAAANQIRYNEVLGVRPVQSGSAADSADVFRQAAAEQDRLAAAAQRYKDQLNPLLPLQRVYRAQLLEINEAARAGLLTETQRAAALARTKEAFAGQVVGLSAAGNAAAQSAASYRRFGAIAQQSGYQVGDFAVQVASGQNALVAFTQQSAQLLGVFGPLGAVIGAGVAVVGALAVGLLRASGETKTAEERAKDYDTAMRNLKSAADATAGAIRGVANETAELARTQGLQAITAQKEFIAGQQSRLSALREEMQIRMDAAGGPNIGGERGAAKSAQALSQAADAVARVEAEIGNAQVRLDAAQASLDRLAGAGAEAYRNFASAQERELELSKMGTKQREIAVAQLDAEMKVRTAMAGQSATDVEAAVKQARERAAAIVEAQNRVAEAERAAGTAGKQANREREKAAKDWLGVLRTVAAEQQKSDEAKAKAVASIDDQIQGIRDETAQLGMSNVERAISIELLKAEETAKNANTVVTQKQADAIRDEVTAREAARESTARQKQAAEDAAREAEHTTDRVVDYAGDTFADFFEDTPKSWKDMWNDMYSTAKQTLAKLAADLVLRPVISPIVNAVYGTQGAGGVPGLGGVAGTGGTAGGGFSLSSISDVGRIFSMGGGSLSPGLDAFAQGAFGFGQMGGSAPLAMGPFLPGQAAGLANGGSALAGFSSLSNVLGIAGAAIPGLMSGNYGQAAAGVAGATIGTLILPGIGTALGGMFGNLVGGLFGKGSKDELKILSANNRQGNELLGDTFDDNLALKSPFGYVGLSDNKTSGYDAGFVSNMVKALQRSDRGVAQYLSGEEITSVSGVLQSTGGYSRSDREFDEEEFGKVIRGRLRPILEALDINQQLVTATLSGTDAEELQQAAQELLARRQAIRDIIDYSGEEGEIRKAERSAFEQLASAVDELSLANEDFGFSAEKAAAAQKRLVEQYLGIGETVEPMTAAEKALAAMNERIEQTAALAKQVGITLTPSEIEAQLREQLRTGFDEGIADQIKAITDPLGFALEQFDEAAAARVEEAKLLGADLVAVERLNAIERGRVIEQYGAQTTNRLREWLDQQSLGSLSSLSPDRQIMEARRQFDTAIDTRDFDKITGAADAYLGIAQNFYASSAQYAAIERFVRGQVEGMLGDSGGTLTASDMGAAISGSGGGAAAAAVPLPPVATGSSGGSESVVVELRKQVAELQRVVMVLQAGFQLVEAQGADASTQRADTNRHLRQLVAVKA